MRKHAPKSPLLSILVAICLLLFGGGCSGLNPYKIGERSIARALTDLLGPARHYSVHIERSGTRLSGGYLSHLTVGVDDLRTKSGILIHRLDADLYGVRFDRRRQVVNSVERSAFTASLTDDAANAYLATHNRGITGLSVHFKPGIVVVNATPKVFGVTVPVTLEGRGHAENGNLVRFKPDTVAISRLRIPPAAVQFVIQRADPVFNLDDLQLPARLESVEPQDGFLLLRGEVKLPSG